MAYRLDKPYTERERADFIIEYNHNNNLRIEETERTLFALEPYEILINDEVVDNTEEYEKEQAQKERERIAMLSLTKREVFLALYKDKGLTPEDIRTQIQDVSALIEFDYATEYYRGNPLIDTIGAMLGYTSEQLDYLFEHKEIPNVE